jgi:hypothetical protein
VLGLERSPPVLPALPSTALPGKEGQSLSVFSGATEQHAIHGVSTQKNMKVMVERKANPTMDLHTVLDQLASVLARVGLGSAGQLVGEV